MFFFIFLKHRTENMYKHILSLFKMVHISPLYLLTLYYFFFALYKAVMFIHYIWIGPSQAIFVLVVLWKELGVSALSGFGVLLCLVPVQSLMGKLFAKLRWVQFKLMCLILSTPEPKMPELLTRICQSV